MADLVKLSQYRMSIHSPQNVSVQRHSHKTASAQWRLGAGSNTDLSRFNLHCRRSSLSEIKSALWEKAVQLPASNYLRDSVHYVFIGVTKQAVEEELDDEMTVEDLHILAKPILEVSEPKLTRDLNTLNHILGIYIPLLALFYTFFYRRPLIKRGDASRCI